MDFTEKLNFLFELTQAEGKELAKAMFITPPQISKMRKGIRGLPRNREAAYTIALFFAQHCRSATQKDALAIAMNVAQVRSIEDDEVLADMLLSWFLNEKPRDTASKLNVDAFLHKMNFSNGTRYSAQTETTQPLRSLGNNTVAYFGISGKQAAYMAFLQHLLERNKAVEICVLSDEDNMWIDDDPSFASSYYDRLLRLTEQGCFFKRIVGPLNSIEQAFYSLNRWFPLYMTGKATSYYYKRMRDSINRITVFVVPEIVALYSFSVGQTPDNNSVTFLTTDVKTINSMSVLFNKYLALCDPAMKIINSDTSEVQMHERLLEYESCAGTCMQLSPSLSFITLPWEIAVSLRTGRESKSKDVFLASFAKRYRVFSGNLETFDFYDFIRLAELSDIIDGRVPIPAASILSDEKQFYTPASYLQHLKNVEYLLKRRKHYNIIIVDNNEAVEPIVYIKENSTVLISRADPPLIIFDVSERNLITAFSENLRRRIPDNVSDEAFKRATLKSIHTLIERIEEYIAAE